MWLLKKILFWWVFILLKIPDENLRVIDTQNYIGQKYSGIYLLKLKRYIYILS